MGAIYRRSGRVGRFMFYESPFLFQTERNVEPAGEAIRHAPSAFNMQDQRVVLLFGDHHEKLWPIVLEALRERVPAEKFVGTAKKSAGLKCSADRTVCFKRRIPFIRSAVSHRDDQNCSNLRLSPRFKRLSGDFMADYGSDGGCLMNLGWENGERYLKSDRISWTET